ncbi:MAG: zinc-ribbon domain-containing protein [Methanobacteriaceae archaeon]|nr:zinc-ribbon domain-containing protein [Methanobacteriaceae archaeon]
MYSESTSNDKNFCPKCGSAVRPDAVFCKKCGYSMVGGDKSRIEKWNDKINILSIFIGLGVSVVFLFIGALFYSFLLSQGILDLVSYFGLVIITMIFFGGLTVGILSCNDYSDAPINGGFLTLILFILGGLVTGTGFSTTLGFAGAIASAYSSILPSTNSYSSDIVNSTDSGSSQAMSSDSIFFVIKIVVIGIIALLSGIAGSYVGVFIKKSLKNR